MKKRSLSITNVLPVLNAAELDPSAATTSANPQTSGSKGYDKLSKAEKKQIKRELLEFAKRTQKQNKAE